MAITTKEITFENEIEYSLIENGGYIKGESSNYNGNLLSTLPFYLDF